MKNILILFFILLTNISFGQIIESDTTKLLIPVNVGKSILVDLNDLERLKKQEVTYKNEIQQLENKVFKNEKIITSLEEKDKKNNEIIELKDSKYKLVDEENKQLRDDIKKIKTKNVIIEIVGGSIIAALTYIITFK
jgi:hypothetical protein